MAGMQRAIGRSADLVWFCSVLSAPPVHVHNDFFLCVLQNAHSDELPPKPSKKKAVASGEGKETKTNKDGSKKKDAAAKDKDKEGKKEAKEKKASAMKKKGAIDGEEERAFRLADALEEVRRSEEQM